jgi:hypothetical protein
MYRLYCRTVQIMVYQLYCVQCTVHSTKQGSLYSYWKMRYSSCFHQIVCYDTGTKLLLVRKKPR